MEKKAVSSNAISCYEGKEPISAVIVVFEDGSGKILCPNSTDGKRCELKDNCVYCK